MKEKISRKTINPKLAKHVRGEKIKYFSLPLMIGYKKGIDIKEKMSTLKKEKIVDGDYWITGTPKDLPEGTYMCAPSVHVDERRLGILCRDPDVVHVDFDPDYAMTD